MRKKIFFIIKEQSLSEITIYFIYLHQKQKCALNENRERKWELMLKKQIIQWEDLAE